jgi:hypothetical protein
LSHDFGSRLEGCFCSFNRLCRRDRRVVISDGGAAPPPPSTPIRRIKRSNVASTASRLFGAMVCWWLASIAFTCASSISQMRASVPYSRSVQAISRMIRVALSTAARACSASGPDIVRAALSFASLSKPRIRTSASGSSFAGACLWAAMVASIRATASSTMLVSALRLRLPYSPRNQRPRAVSMKASRIAS